MGITTHYGDCRAVLDTLPAGSVHACITSPPYYGLRAYSADPREIGREQTPAAYIAAMVDVFARVRRVLRDDGVVVLNLGDSYGAEKQKTLIPHRVALALQADGWYLRSDMPWIKRNAMPESVTDRPSTAHEYVFLLSKSPRYWWDAEAVRVQAVKGDAGAGPRNYRASGNGDGRKHEGQSDNDRCAGRNMRSTDLWFASLDLAIDDARAHLAALERLRERGGTLEDDGDPLALQVNPQPYAGAHFAVFPPALIEPFVKAGCPRQACPHCGAGWVRVVERTGHVNRREPAHVPGNPACACPEHTPVPGVVLDPFGGSGTTAKVAIAHGRDAVLIDLNPDYAELQAQRTDGVQTTLFD